MLMPIHFSFISSPFLLSPIFSSFICLISIFHFAPCIPLLLFRCLIKEEVWLQWITAVLVKSAVESHESRLRDALSLTNGTPIKPTHIHIHIFFASCLLCCCVYSGWLIFDPTHRLSLMSGRKCVWEDHLIKIQWRGVATLACGDESFLCIVLHSGSRETSACRNTSLSPPGSHHTLMRQPSSTSHHLHSNRTGHSIPEQMLEG